MWPRHTLPWAVDHLGYWHKTVLSVVESTPPLARLGHPVPFSMSRVRCYTRQYVLQTLSYLSKQCRVTDQLLNTGTTGLQQVLLFCSSFSSSHTQKKLAWNDQYVYTKIRVSETRSVSQYTLFIIHPLFQNLC